jgi:hypothetical protein
LKIVIPQRGIIVREPALNGVEGNLLFRGWHQADSSADKAGVGMTNS